MLKQLQNKRKPSTHIQHQSNSQHTPSHLPSRPHLQQRQQRNNKNVNKVSKRSMSMNVFNPNLKRIHRDRALTMPGSEDYNYLRSEIATRVLNRVSVIKLPFPNVVILGNDRGGLSEHITQRFIRNQLDPYKPNPVSSGFVLDKPPSLNPETEAAPPTQQEINDTLEYFSRYSINGLKNLTIVDNSIQSLQQTRSEIETKLNQSIPQHSMHFQTHILPCELTTIPFASTTTTTTDTTAVPTQSTSSNDTISPNIIISTDITNSTQPPSTFISQVIPSKTQLVLSNLTLHWENNLPHVFKSAFDILEPNGAFIGAMIGGETLRELRSAITLAEMERTGGVSHHISPFAYTKDVGDLLIKAGFEMVSVDIDTLKIPYPDTFTLISHIQNMGESHAPADPTQPISKHTWLAASAIYDTLYRDQSGLLTCSVDVIMFVGWKGHSSINKPAKRGSATAKLGTIIHTTPDSTTQIPSEQEQIQNFFAEVQTSSQCNNHK